MSIVHCDLCDRNIDTDLTTMDAHAVEVHNADKEYEFKVTILVYVAAKNQQEAFERAVDEIRNTEIHGSLKGYVKLVNGRKIYAVEDSRD